MVAVLYLGKITGVSSMFAEGRHRGYVRHPISIYKDLRQNRAVAGGRIWGNASVLRHGVTGRPIVLSFADGHRWSSRSSGWQWKTGIPWWPPVIRFRHFVSDCRARLYPISRGTEKSVPMARSGGPFA